MGKVAIADLQYPDKVEIFRHLAVDESNNIDISILDTIANTQYQAFTAFCEDVFNNRTDIADIECTIVGEKVQFIMHR